MSSQQRARAEIYMDSNATTRVLPGATQAARAAMEILYGNPSSSHVAGLRARHLLEDSRSRAAKVLGTEPARIVFTSGATEAIQTAVLSTLCEAGGGDTKGRLLLYGATEHKAVPEALRHWSRILRTSHEVVSIPVDTNGRLDLEFLREHARNADMLCTMAVNNETGVVHDLAAIETVLRETSPRTRWLVDCVQAVGKLPLALSRTTIDFACASGHKLYATKGIGLLYVRDGAPVTPLIIGGGQEAGVRSGTENLPGAAALGAVFRSLLEEDGVFRSAETLVRFRDRLATSLADAFPGTVFNTPFPHAIPTTINFAVKGLTSKDLLDLFDAAGMRVSAGSACGSALQGSHVLDAMGLPRWQSEGAIRLSFGPATTDEEIDAACAVIREAGRAIRGSCMFIPEPTGERGEPQTGVIRLKRGVGCTWIYAGSDGRCVIVDPDVEVCHRIDSFVRCQDVRVAAVLETHARGNRPSCREQLLDRLGEHAEAARTADPLGWPDSPDGTVTLADGEHADVLRLADGDVLVRTCLTDTDEGRGYLLGRPGDGTHLRPEEIRLAFTGDAVRIGGRPAGVVSTSGEVLHRLETIISPHTVLCPAYDEADDLCTTLAAERAADGGDTAETSLHVPPGALAAFLRSHEHARIIDVREMHESRYGGWEAMGLMSAPINVPLTRFAELVAELLDGPRGRDEIEVILFCRSGNRSGRAASVLRRLGIPGAWHLEGGLAAFVPESMAGDQ